jgi:hypothetical protein
MEATTMFTDHLSAAIVAGPSNRKHLGDLTRKNAQAYTAGVFSYDQWQANQEAIDARQQFWAPGQGGGRKNAPAAVCGRRRRQRSPDRARSIERRRAVAATHAMPPNLACKYTTGEQAVLVVVAREFCRRGQCRDYVAKIAAQAGVCDRLVQLAMRKAERNGHIRIEERRVSAFRNDTNILTIISPEWLAWLRVRMTGGLGEFNFEARGQVFKKARTFSEEGRNFPPMRPSRPVNAAARDRERDPRP